MDADQLTAVGRAVLTTISALDSGRTLPPPSAYVLLGGKVVPGWAISLFVLSLLVPVLMTTIDGVARARRRGHIIWRSLTVVLAAAVPFVLPFGSCCWRGWSGSSRWRRPARWRPARSR